MSVINPDLHQERQNATITSEEFAIWWSGGYNELCKQKALQKLFFDDPQFVDRQPIGNLSHKELYEYTTAKAVGFLQKLKEWHRQQCKQLNNSTHHPTIEDMYEFRTVLAGPLSFGLFPQNFPLRLHFGMFLPALLGHGSEEQRVQWLEKAWNMDGIIGTYAQTELGHGTNLRGLETRADYDVEKQEFVLNSPTLTSYKWWPGGLGHAANVVILMAQLYIKHRPYGLQPFLVRIRNEQTHMPEPGVDVGEVGPRIGLNGVGNGFLGLKNVRIPLNQMLAKHNQVLPDGTFVRGPEPLLLYGTMVYVRVMIVRDAALNLLQAATIATRYSAVRRQGVAPLISKEIQIIDFLTQQQKLFPQIAKGIFFSLAADHVWQGYRQVDKELNAGSKRHLPELHALSCCLKALCSHESAKGVEILRKACGGHGFMASSNFGNIYAAATAACTYEGENTVLLLQTARFLVKKYEDGVKRKVLPKSVEYLRLGDRIKWSMHLETLVRIMEITAMSRIKHAFHMQRKFGKEATPQSYNRAGIILVNAAIMHGKAFLARLALTEVKQQFKEKKINNSLSAVVQQLLDIFVMDLFLSSTGDILCYSSATINAKHVLAVEQRYEETLLAFRCNAVAVVDGFDFHDRVLSSVLGCYDGRAYERLVEEARRCELNASDSIKVTFEGHLKKLMMAKL